MEEKEIICLYGSEHQRSILFVYGGWYVCEGSGNINCCNDPLLLVDGVDIETLTDIDCFTTNEPITSLKELIKAVWWFVCL